MLDRIRSFVSEGPSSTGDHHTVLERVRWRFVLLNLVGLSLGPLTLTNLVGVTWVGATVYLTALALLATWLVVLYRTGGRLHAGEVGGPVLVAVIGIAAGSYVWAFGPMYMTLFLHSLYGDRRRVLRNAVLYVVAYQVVVLVTDGLALLVSDQLLTTIVAALVMAWVMHEMATSLRSSDVARERERTLTEASGRLLRARDPREVAEVAADGITELASLAGPSPRVSIWRQDGDAMHLLANTGPSLGIEQIDLAAMPVALVTSYLEKRPVRIAPAQMREAGQAAGATNALDHGLVVPLTDGDGPLGVVAVETVGLLDDDALVALQRFAQEVSLAERATRRSRLLSAVVHNSADGIVLVDDELRLAFVSPSVAELAGRPVEVGEPLGALLARACGEEDDVAPGARALGSVDDLDHSAGLVVRRIDGSLLEVEVSARPVAGAGTVLNIRDVSEQRRLQAEISYRAFYDSLTDLPNRALFLDRLAHALARAQRDGSQVAVALLDLDDFKTVNDRFGHLAGDQLLCHVAAQIRSHVRASDTVARLGGDEFALIFEGAGDAEALQGCLDAALEAVGLPQDLDGNEVSVSASGGLATSDGAHSADLLLGEADLAMYVAKSRGKATSVTFHRDLRADIDERRQLRDELEAGIDRGELRLHYQPVLALADGTTTGAEALVRWQHPTRGLLSPDRFVPLAEETGLVVGLGRWVLTTACRELARWQEAGLIDDRFQLHVNLSVRQLADDGLFEDVRAALEDHGIAPRHLVVEVTETALAENPALAEATLRELHQLGIAVAIDDFGTGYASFTYLRRFPVDIVKIDRSFVSDIDDGPRPASLAQAIVRLAASLGMTTVAEGIEHEQAREMLAGWGCHHGQGWLWTPALPDADIAVWLREAADLRRAGVAPLDRHDADPVPTWT